MFAQWKPWNYRDVLTSSADSHRYGQYQAKEKKFPQNPATGVPKEILAIR